MKARGSVEQINTLSAQQKSSMEGADTQLTERKSSVGRRRKPLQKEQERCRGRHPTKHINTLISP
jgi:hypothetical protein